MAEKSLPLPHTLLALAVVSVWGTNFVIMKFALGHLPPLTLSGLRFAFAALPWVFFCKRPAGWGNLAAYGLLIGVGQFGALYTAMNGHISPGLASLVVQVQAFFTIGLAMALTGERVKGFQYAALALAAAGLSWLMIHTNAEVTPLGLGLTLTAAMGWAGGNIVARRAGQVNMVAYVVWSSLFAAPALFALSCFVDGPAAMASSMRAAGASTWAAVAWQSLGNSLFGYAAWGWLLARHPADGRPSGAVGAGFRHGRLGDLPARGPVLLEADGGGAGARGADDQYTLADVKAKVDATWSSSLRPS